MSAEVRQSLSLQVRYSFHIANIKLQDLAYTDTVFSSKNSWIMIIIIIIIIILTKISNRNVFSKIAVVFLFFFF